MGVGIRFLLIFCSPFLSDGVVFGNDLHRIILVDISNEDTVVIKYPYQRQEYVFLQFLGMLTNSVFVRTHSLHIQVSRGKTIISGTL